MNIWVYCAIFSLVESSYFGPKKVPAIMVCHDGGHYNVSSTSANGPIGNKNLQVNFVTNSTTVGANWCNSCKLCKVQIVSLGLPVCSQNELNSSGSTEEGLILSQECEGVNCPQAKQNVLGIYAASKHFQFDTDLSC